MAERVKSLGKQLMESPDRRRALLQERAIVRATELIETLLEQQGISRTDLADMLGKHKSWVTQLLDGEKNKTIRTVADVLAVLGHEMRISSEPIASDAERHFVAYTAHWPSDADQAAVTGWGIPVTVIDTSRLSVSSAYPFTAPTFGPTSMPAASSTSPRPMLQKAFEELESQIA
jgi:antitoxin component HigA of HigAB toxin-antitoxin module